MSAQIKLSLCVGWTNFRIEIVFELKTVHKLINFPAIIFFLPTHVNLI